jgi:hypothetical protein
MSATKVDPWKEAAECERALQIATNTEQRNMLVYLREMWIALANESAFLSADDFAKEAEAVIQIQTDMTADIVGNLH